MNSLTSKTSYKNLLIDRSVVIAAAFVVFHDLGLLARDGLLARALDRIHEQIVRAFDVPHGLGRIEPAAFVFPLG